MFDKIFSLNIGEGVVGAVVVVVTVESVGVVVSVESVDIVALIGADIVVWEGVP